MTLATTTPAGDVARVTKWRPLLPAPRADPSPNGDSVSSGGIQLSDAQSPISPDDWQPIHTYIGTKWVPTIAVHGLCPDCRVRQECGIDVASGHFAWCERIIPADFQLTNNKHTAHASSLHPT